jgi:cytochrome c oxidase subunit 3
MSQLATQHDSSGGEHGAHPAHLAHHFSDLEQQKECATLGMWLFLGTEVMLFGVIFTCYFVYRYRGYEAFVHASNELWVTLGTLNTCVLLGSSFAMALAVHAAHAGNARKIVRYILVTIVLGCTFLGVKVVEYSIDYHEGLIPWLHWAPAAELEAAKDPQFELFFVFYFTMTLLHALHMVAGMSVLGWIAWLARKGRFSAKYYTPVEMSGLYWHFVDIVWVFLFPALYLVNPALKVWGHH